MCLWHYPAGLSHGLTVIEVLEVGWQALIIFLLRNLLSIALIDTYFISSKVIWFSMLYLLSTSKMTRNLKCLLKLFAFLNTIFLWNNRWCQYLSFGFSSNFISKRCRSCVRATHPFTKFGISSSVAFILWLPMHFNNDIHQGKCTTHI